MALSLGKISHDDFSYLPVDPIRHSLSASVESMFVLGRGDLIRPGRVT
jgi:hypothetical protein